MSNDFNNIDELFKESFADFSAPPSVANTSTWAAIKSGVSKKMFLKFAAAKFNVYYASAIVATTGTTGTIVYNEIINDPSDEVVVEMNEENLIPELEAEELISNDSITMEDALRDIMSQTEASEEEETEQADDKFAMQVEEESKLRTNEDIDPKQTDQAELDPIKADLIEESDIEKIIETQVEETEIVVDQNLEQEQPDTKTVVKKVIVQPEQVVVQDTVYKVKKSKTRKRR